MNTKGTKCVNGKCVGGTVLETGGRKADKAIKDVQKHFSEESDTEDQLEKNLGEEDSGGDSADDGGGQKEDCPWGRNEASGCCNCDPKADPFSQFTCNVSKLFGCEAPAGAEKNCMGLGFPCGYLVMGGLAVVVLILAMKALR